MTMQDIVELKDEYRGLPFWCWNGDINEEEIPRQIRVLKEMGFGGFFIHSRTGLKTEYLGDKWFKLVDLTIKEAEKVGLSVWLYDEDRWPSGTCGGLVTKERRFRLKFISMYDAGEAITCDHDELYSFAIKLGGDKKLIDYYRLNDGDTLKEGYGVKKFVVEYMQMQEFYNGYTYLDTLNYEATQAFLSSTHERYRERFGDKFGKSLIGIFTDEPHRGALLNGFGLHNENKMRMLPYSYELFKEYEITASDKLHDKLPELYYLKQGEKINRVMYNYIETLQRMFLDNFAKPYKEWCNKNNLVVTGHILHEDSLAIQTIFQGSALRYYEYMDYPGIDVLTEHNRAYFVAKQVTSVARQLGKKHVLSELYGCTGWQFNFKSHRDVGTWQAMFGINMRCHHLCWYTMEGESKRDYPASIFYQSEWYRDYKFIEDYFTRLNNILSVGQSICSTLVIDPIESVWLYPREGWIAEGFTTSCEEVREIDSKYYELFNILTTGHVDFDYGNEDIISRHYSIVVNGGKTFLKIGEIFYDKVVIAGVHNLRSSTESILSEFASCGGKVLFVGEKPRYVQLNERTLSEKLLNSSESVRFERYEILKSLHSQKFLNMDSEEVISAVRKIDDGYLVVLLNSNRENALTGRKLSFNDTYNITEIIIEDGDYFTLEKNSDTIEIDFHAGECKAFKLTKDYENVKERQVYSIGSAIEFNETSRFSYELLDDNILPLDLADYSINDLRGDKPTEIIRADRKIREKYKLNLRGGEMIQPWFVDKFNLEKNNGNIGILSIEYSFFIGDMPNADIYLVMEQSELYEIHVNGNKLVDGNVGRWIDRCFDKLTLNKELLCLGKNEITLSVTYNNDVNLENIYLLGKFGIKLEGTKKTICKLPETLSIGDISGQSLPFYSGRIAFHTGICDETVKVKLKDCYGAFVKVRDNSSSQIIAFDPYESKAMRLDGELILELSLTRRNTFGPLHLNTVNAYAYDPTLFVNEFHYMDEYSLVPQGLLHPFIVEILK